MINPFSEKVSGKKIERRLRILKSLQGDEKEMLYALAQERGLKGLGEEEIVDFSSLSRKSLLPLAQELEAEGKIRILSFSPLFILSQAYFGFLCQKILVFLESFHKKHPEQAGASLERIKRRFDFPPGFFPLPSNTSRGQGRLRKLTAGFPSRPLKSLFLLKRRRS